MVDSKYLGSCFQGLFCSLTTDELYGKMKNSVWFLSLVSLYGMKKKVWLLTLLIVLFFHFLPTIRPTKCHQISSQVVVINIKIRKVIIFYFLTIVCNSYTYTASDSSIVSVDHK